MLLLAWPRVDWPVSRRGQPCCTLDHTSLSEKSERGSMDFQALLRFAVENHASDGRIQADLPPTFRIGGILRQSTVPPVKDEEIRAFIAAIAPSRFRENIDDRIAAGLDFSY